MKIIVFGEDSNDIRAIKELILGLRHDLAATDIKALREPPTLTRGARGRAMKSWAEKARKSIAAAKVTLGEITCVLAHSDADGPDDGTFAAARTAELLEAGVEGAVAVVPVETIESWWLLFPNATESVVPSWKGALSKKSFNTDLVAKPKAELIQRTRAKQPKRPYQEGDSPAIAQAIAGSHLDVPQKANSPSFERFRTIVASCTQSR